MSDEATVSDNYLYGEQLREAGFVSFNLRFNLWCHCLLSRPSKVSEVFFNNKSSLNKAQELVGQRLVYSFASKRLICYPMYTYVSVVMISTSLCASVESS